MSNEDIIFIPIPENVVMTENQQAAISAYRAWAVTREGGKEDVLQQCHDRGIHPADPQGEKWLWRVNKSYAYTLGREPLKIQSQSYCHGLWSEQELLERKENGIQENQ